MRTDEFSEAQVSLLKAVFLSKAPSSLDLLEKLLVGDANRDERSLICELINEEFCEVGLEETGEPTSYGLELEALLDIVNRPNLYCFS